jgi:hypothetical protein
VFASYLDALQTFLRGDSAPFDALSFHEQVAPDVSSLGLAATAEASRIAWLPDSRPKVEVDVAATGCKLIELSACRADRIMFAFRPRSN